MYGHAEGACTLHCLFESVNKVCVCVCTQKQFNDCRWGLPVYCPCGMMQFLCSLCVSVALDVVSCGIIYCGNIISEGITAAEDLVFSPTQI